MVDFIIFRTPKGCNEVFPERSIFVSGSQCILLRGLTSDKSRQRHLRDCPCLDRRSAWQLAWDQGVRL